MGYDLKAIASTVSEKPLAFIQNTFAAELDDDEQAPDLEKKIAEQEQEIERLTRTVQEQKREISDYESQIKKLTNEMEQNAKDAEDLEQKQQNLASMYEGMTPSKSAAIIEKLTLNEAAVLLDRMGSTEKAAILGKMNTAIAADITIALRDLDQAEQPEVAAMQERLSLLMNAIERKESSIPIEDLAKQMEDMEETKAAGILEAMSEVKEEKDVAVGILSALNESKRTLILSEMDESVSSTYVAELAD